MRYALVVMMVGALGCGDASLLSPMPDLSVPWVTCERDPTTGAPVQPNCSDSEPIVVHLMPRASRAGIPSSRVEVTGTTDHEGVVVLAPSGVEAVEHPPELPEAWFARSMFLNFAGAWDPSLGSATTTRQGRAELYLGIESFPEENGVPVPVEVELHADDETISFLVMPYGVEDAR